MKMVIHDVKQGSADWLALRANHFCASDAPAMMGVSPYKTRQQLMAEFCGTKPEVSEHQQKLFDRGHEAEAKARAIIEARTGEEFYPITATRGRILASSDGVTIGGDVGFEHKLLNADLAAAVDAGIVPDAYIWQLEQQAYVLGLEKIIFAVSNGDEESLRTVDYIPDPEKQAKLIAGWEQFEKDLANFNPVAGLPEAKAAPIESLPVPFVEIVGRVTKTNLADFKRVALERIGAIKTDLVTDADFADAEAMVKFLDDAEKRIDVVKEQALAQAASIQDLFKTLDDIKALSKAKRLEVDKLVKRRKEERRAEIVQSGRARYLEHVASLNERLGRALVTPQALTPPDFNEAIKGKRSFASMVDAVDSTLANAKLDANALADRLQANIATLDKACAEHANLFPDYTAIVFKQADDLAILIQSRIAEAKAKEEARIAAERERIRAEEEAKAQREAAEKLRQMQADEQTRLAANKAAATGHVVAASPAPVPIIKSIKAVRPTDAEIVMALRFKFSATHDEVIGWLREMNLDSVPVAA